MFFERFACGSHVESWMVTGPCFSSGTSLNARTTLVKRLATLLCAGKELAASKLGGVVSLLALQPLQDRPIWTAEDLGTLSYSRLCNGLTKTSWEWQAQLRRKVNLQDPLTKLGRFPTLGVCRASKSVSPGSKGPSRPSKSVQILGTSWDHTLLKCGNGKSLWMGKSSN